MGAPLMSPRSAELLLLPLVGGAVKWRGNLRALRSSPGLSREASHGWASSTVGRDGKTRRILVPEITNRDLRLFSVP